MKPLYGALMQMASDAYWALAVFADSHSIDGWRVQHVAIVDNEVLPPISLAQLPAVFMTISGKMTVADDTRCLCPCDLDSQRSE